MRLEGDRSEGAGGCPAISLLGEPLSQTQQPNAAAGHFFSPRSVSASAPLAESLRRH